MVKATLAVAWEFVQREALNGLVTFAHVRSKAEPLGVNNRHLMKLRELGFLEVENKSRGDHRVMYRLSPTPPPTERLTEYDRLKRK